VARGVSQRRLVPKGRLGAECERQRGTAPACVCPHPEARGGACSRVASERLIPGIRTVGRTGAAPWPSPSTVPPSGLACSRQTRRYPLEREQNNTVAISVGVRLAAHSTMPGNARREP
jgi:hypothetical protein